METETTEMLDTSGVSDRLRAPMSPEQRRIHPAGYPYFSGSDIIRRVIDATDNNYSWEILRISQEKDVADRVYWWVHGRLTIPGLGAREGIGVHQAAGGSTNPQWTEAVKAASTDAFKRAAALFGVGLECDGELMSAPGVPTASISERTPPDSHRSNRNNWPGPGSCPECNAPEGKPHATRCVYRDPPARLTDEV